MSNSKQMKHLRCFSCNKTISMIDAITNKCRCEKNFCLSHRIDHVCSFDYQKHYEQNNSLVKIENEKLEKI